MKKFTEIAVETTTEGSELVAYFLGEVSPFGVSIFDSKDITENATWDYAEQSLLTDDKVVTVKGFVENEDEKSVLAFLQEKFETLDKAVFGSLEISVSVVDAYAWHEKWKETFVPLTIGNFVICPKWLECDSNGLEVLKLDSGIAFGTGQHQTTSMCIELLSEVDLQDKTVVDVGCGSGILGLCALLSGAKSATLIDNDSQATEAALQNAKLNNLLNRCKIQNANLVDSTEQTFDIVLANLTAEILLVLANDISKIVHSKSIVILSGILLDRVDKVKNRFLKKGLRLTGELQNGEWCALKLEC